MTFENVCGMSGEFSLNRIRSCILENTPAACSVQDNSKKYIFGREDKEVRRFG
jgi:hypothetical protein